MPDVPYATLQDGYTSWGAEPGWIAESDRGDRGQRDYLVNTADPERARTAANMPRMGDSWAPDRPDLVVVDIEPPRYIGFMDDSATGLGGHTWIRVRYETPGASGRVELKKTDGTRDYTEIQYETGTVKVTYDVRVDDAVPGAPSLRIANGLGVERQVVGTVLVVHRFRPWSPTPLGLILAAHNTPINSVPLRLPPEKGGSVPIDVDPLLARFLGAERTPVDAVNRRKGLEWTFRLLVYPRPPFGFADSSPHDVLWQQEDKRGYPVASVISWIYRRGDYTALLNA